MAYEQPQSKSEGYQLFQEWEGAGELAGIIGESLLMPVGIPFEILGDIAGEVMDGFSDSNTHD